MDPAHRRRLDYIIGLLTILTTALLALLIEMGGIELLVYALVLGLIVSVLLQQVVLAPET